MQKWLHTYLILNILASTLPSSYAISILKLGNLAIHYHHHQSEGQSRNLLSFLTDHYTAKHHEEDHKNHENLPFHNHHHDQQNLSPQSPFLLPQLHEIVAFPKLEMVSNPLIFRSQQWLSSLFSGDIWQPPKA